MIYANVSSYLLKNLNLKLITIDPNRLFYVAL